MTAGLLAASGAFAASNAITATEGAQFSGQVGTMVADCTGGVASLSGSIAWGDGQNSGATYTPVAGMTPPRYTISGSHTYGEEGSYAGTVSSTYTCTGSTSPSTVPTPFSAQVSDASLSASGSNVSATAGQQFSGQVASFTDADPADAPGDYSAQVNWGDGASSPGTVSASGGGFTVAGSHTYASAGSYTISVTIKDAGGSSAQAQGTASVGTASGPPFTASVGVTSTGAGQAVFKASASGPVSRFVWNVTGGSQPDVVCPGSDPGLTVYTRGPLSHDVSLTAVGAGGSSTVAHSFVNIPPPPRAHPPRIAKHGNSHLGPIVHPSFSLLGDCQGAPLPHPQDPRHPGAGTKAGPGGSPPPQCDGQDVVFGAVDAQGCLYPVTDLLNEIHPADYQTIQHLLCAHSTFFCVPSPDPAKTGGHAFGFGARAIQECSTCGAFAYVNAMIHNYISYSPVRINGLDFDPQNGAPIILVPGADLVVSSDANIVMDGVPVSTAHSFALYLPDAGGHLGTFPGASHIPIIGSLPFVGDVGVDIHKAGSALGNGDTCQYACSSITVHVSLPPIFTSDNPSDPLLTADGVITADNPGGLHLDSLEVKVPHADFAGVGVKDVDFSYHRQTDAFHGQATLELAIITVGGSVDFVHGQFKGASALVDDLNIPLGEGFFLNEIDAGFSLHPTTLMGGATVTGGPEVLGSSLVSIHAGLALQIDPFSFDLKGTGSILNQQVGDAYFHVDDQGNIGLGGTVDINLDNIVEAKAGLNINVDVPQGHFQADALADACVFQVCGGGEIVISDRGVGACLDLGFTHAGGGVELPSGHIDWWWSSCDIDTFRSIHSVADRLRRGRAAAVPAFTVPAGQRVAVFGLVGQGAAPRATLRGPDGRTIDTPSTSPVLKDPNEVVIRDDRQTNTTYFFINHPAAGNWTVTPDPGSAPIISLQQSHALPNPSVHASIKLARGGRARLHYSVLPISGQSVTFAEQASGGALRLIGSAHGAHGTIVFQPSGALTRGRAIVALVSQNGHPRTDIVVARYKAPSPAKLPAPRGLTVRRRGTGLTISWRSVPRAVSYLLNAHLSDGRKVALVTTSRQRTVTIGSVPGTITGQFQVAASADKLLHRLGRRGHVKLRSGPRPRAIAIAPVIF